MTFKRGTNNRASRSTGRLCLAAFVCHMWKNWRLIHQHQNLEEF